MSVYCDEIVGYSLDIQKEFIENKDELQHLLEAKQDKFNEIGFENYDSMNSLIDKVSILYDGMSGEYTKLIYILDYEKNTSEIESTHTIKTVNELLSTSAVPFSVKQKIKRVYKELFGKDLNKTSSIIPEYIIHWH